MSAARSPVTTIGCAGVDRQLGGFGGLVLAGLLVGLLDEWRQRESLVRRRRRTGQVAHLADQAAYPLDAVGQRSVERGAELRILPFLRQQLLVGGERHQRVADFMRQAVGHGFHQTQIGSLDFQASQLLALRQVFRHQQRGARQAGLLPLERNDIDVVNGAGRSSGSYRKLDTAEPVLST